MGIQERIDAASQWLVYELGERGHKLDCSLEGVAALDSLIEGPTPLTSLLDVDLEPLSTAIGAFVGEVIRQRRSADWNALDWSAAGMPFPDDEPLRLVVLVVHGKGNADPIRLAQARLERPSTTAFRFVDFAQRGSIQVLTRTTRSLRPSSRSSKALTHRTRRGDASGPCRWT